MPIEFPPIALMKAPNSSHALFLSSSCNWSWALAVEGFVREIESEHRKNPHRQPLGNDEATLGLGVGVMVGEAASQ